MTRGFMGLVLLLIWVGSVSAQQSRDWLDDFLYSESDERLEDAIVESSKIHAMYSYNLSNAATQGFVPILSREDQLELAGMVPDDSYHFNQVVIEHLTTKMARNSRRQAAFYAMYRKKVDNYRQVVSFGKK
ncbi:MAG: hypothetical protein CL521_00525 [Actinobacteria bacterium]|nr:hypothetical protein [Actinomycetota bacterium]